LGLELFRQNELSLPRNAQGIDLTVEVNSRQRSACRQPKGVVQRGGIMQEGRCRDGFGHLAIPSIGKGPLSGCVIDDLHANQDIRLARRKAGFCDHKSDKNTLL
jgi:hypothetical protein